MKHLNHVLHTLDRSHAGGPGRYREPLAKIALNLGRRGIVVLISDLYDTPDGSLARSISCATAATT